MSRKHIRRIQYYLVPVFALLAISFNNCSGFETIESGITTSSSTFDFTSDGTLPELTLTSSVDQDSAPFTVGHAFHRGDVPAGQGLQILGADAQIVPKNYWSDGSLKFAIISGRASVRSGMQTKLSFAKAPFLSGTALTVNDLKSSGLQVSIGAGNFGNVNWASADWDQVFKTWISGPRMSSFIYRKSIGSDAHLVAWLEVRVFAGGAVEVLPWVENGYLNVPGPTTKSDVFTLSINGQQKFNMAVSLPHHTRSPLINGTALSYWVGQDPQIVPRHDVQYFQKTELVPTYGASVDPSQASILASTYTPLQQGNFTFDSDSMPSSGYQRPIGLLPTHDVFYLVCENPRIVYESVIRNGYSSGRYPIHYRDETTQQPFRFSSYPNLVVADGCGWYNTGASTKNQRTPACSGTGTRTWDTAHSPSVGYMAYLLSGRWYFMEEVQFAATTNYLGITDGVMRHYANGLLHPVPGAFQTRSSAWTIRTLVQALAVTPDDETILRNEFKNSWEYNIKFHHDKYIAQSNNPFGLVKPGEGYGNGINLISPWQQDFLTAAWGYALALDLPVSAEHAKKTAEFFRWKARSVVGRLGPASEFWYVNGAPYTISISNTAVPDFDTGKGPWHADWRTIYSATYSTPPAWMSNKEGTLAAEYTIDTWSRSMWGNLQPAIAYAVRFSVPGAQEGYNRMKNADNWGQMTSYFGVHPVWAVVPPRK